MNEMMSRGEYYTTMLDRLKALPNEILHAHPHFAVSYAWLLSITLQLDEVEPRLKEVEKISGENLSAEIRLEILVIRAFLARQRKDFAKSTELSLKALSTLPENPYDDNPLQREVRTGIVFNLGYIHLLGKGDATEAEKWFSKAISISEAASSITLILGAMDGISHCRILQGKLYQAAETYRKGMQLAGKYEQQRGQEIPAASYATIGLGNILREQNKLDEAFYHLSHGIDMSHRWQIGDVLCKGYMYQARLKQAQGDIDGALESIRQAEQLPYTYRIVPIYGGPIAACRMHLLLMKGMSENGEFDPSYLDEIQKWADDQGFRLNGPINSLEDEYEYLVWARLLLAQNENEKSSQLLAHLLEAAEDRGRTERVIEILILQALALQSLIGEEVSLKTLKRALLLAEPEGYIRLFVDEGRPMERLLQRAESYNYSPGYVSQLLEAFEKETAQMQSSPQSSAFRLIDPLSDREIEVLHLLMKDLSGLKIADKLFISLNTVKTHIKNIYSKLNVHSRSEAVELAKKLHLIS